MSNEVPGEDVVLVLHHIFEIADQIHFSVHVVFNEMAYRYGILLISRCQFTVVNLNEFRYLLLAHFIVEMIWERESINKVRIVIVSCSA